MADDALHKKVSELEAELDQLAVLCRALQEACLRKKVFTREELKILVHEIDACDGAVDSKVRKLPKSGRE